MSVAIEIVIVDHQMSVGNVKFDSLPLDVISNVKIAHSSPLDVSSNVKLLFFITRWQ